MMAIIIVPMLSATHGSRRAGAPQQHDEPS